MNTPAERTGRAPSRAYGGRVTVSAHDVARVLRQQLPGLGKKKLHKLLYLCQGHHLAALGVPMFNEEVHAHDMGPVVDRLWKHERAGRSLLPVEVDEAGLNTVALVISRYGSLTGRELELLSHAQDPWIDADEARLRGRSDVITKETLARYFATALSDDEDEAPWPAHDVIAQWLAGTPRQPPPVHDYDDIDRLRERARGR